MTRTVILSKDSIKETAILYGIFAIIGGAALTASLLGGFSICLVYNITGIPSPACGMVRAFMSLPNIRTALAYHPLFFVPPFIPLMALTGLRVRNITSIMLIILFFIVWAARMVMFFPHTEPMLYNDNSLFELIRSFINGRTF